jgi:hypothetical protein
VRTTTAGNCTVESSAFRTLIFVFVPNFGFASNHQFEMNRIRKYVVVVAVRTPNGLGPNTADSDFHLATKRSVRVGKIVRLFVAHCRSPTTTSPVSVTKSPHFLVALWHASKIQDSYTPPKQQIYTIWEA